MTCLIRVTELPTLARKNKKYKNRKQNDNYDYPKTFSFLLDRQFNILSKFILLDIAFLSLFRSHPCFLIKWTRTDAWAVNFYNHSLTPLSEEPLVILFHPTGNFLQKRNTRETSSAMQLILALLSSLGLAHVDGLAMLLCFLPCSFLM